MRWRTVRTVRGGGGRFLRLDRSCIAMMIKMNDSSKIVNAYCYKYDRGSGPSPLPSRRRQEHKMSILAGKVVTTLVVATVFVLPTAWKRSKLSSDNNLLCNRVIE